MRGDTNRKENLEDVRGPLNNIVNQSSEQNRGIELILRSKRRREEPPKTFQLRFGKMVTLFRREFHLNFDISLDVQKVRRTKRC
jgi:hypothetical protein